MGYLLNLFMCSQWKLLQMQISQVTWVTEDLQVGMLCSLA